MDFWQTYAEFLRKKRKVGRSAKKLYIIEIREHIKIIAFLVELSAKALTPPPGC